MSIEGDAAGPAGAPAGPASREIYAYYRVPRRAADAARAVVNGVQAALRSAHPGLVARLLRRGDDADPAGPETWLETYARPTSPGGVEPGLQAAIEVALAPLHGLIDGARHLEVFAADGAAQACAREEHR